MNPKKIREKIELYYYIAVAKYAFYSHGTPQFKLSRGEKFINLWHGNGIKNKNFCDLGSNFDYVLCSSEFYEDYYIKNVNCKKEQMLFLGNPRNDLLFKNENIISKYYPKILNKKIIWMPTFRKQRNGDNHFNSEYDYKFGVPLIVSDREMRELEEILKSKKMTLFIKLHPEADTKNVEKLELNNIVFLTNNDLDAKNIQLYSLLRECDALITDYSSVYTDYLLLNRPIAFTLNDMKDYKTGFICENPLELMPGNYIYNKEDLLNFIGEVEQNNDRYKEVREATNKKLNKYNENFSERIIKKIGIV